MQAGNTQSEQFSNLQQTTKLQSKSTQPVALNPNQLDSRTTLTVVGSPSLPSPAQDTPAVVPLWPFLILGTLALVSIVVFTIAISRILRPIPVIEKLEPASKPKRPKKKQPKKKNRR